MATSSKTLPAPPTNQPGRQDGHHQELTVVAPMKPGAAAQARETWEKILSIPEDEVRAGLRGLGTMHEARSFLIDNDTRFVFCSSFDGDFGDYIEGWANHPVAQPLFDANFGVCEGYPGMRSPDVGAWFAEHRIKAGNYRSGYPDLTLLQILKDQEVNDAFQDVLDTPEFRAALENPANAALLATPAFQKLLDVAAG
jgi:hypothetical protein